MDDLFRKAGLDESQRKRLARNLICSSERGDCRVQPNRDLMRNMAPAVRGRIYDVLREYRVNRFIRNGIRWRIERQGKRLDWTALSPKAFKVVSNLSYQNGDFMELTDIAVACSLLSETEDRLSLLRTLTRITALMGRLHVPHGADIRDLLDYWGRGRRSKSIRALLTSLAAKPGGGTVDISHLFPPFARSRLFTYPEPDEPPWDCHWTSLNFWNDRLDDPMESPENITRLVRELYEPIRKTERRFGDMIVLTDQTNQAIHAAIYVADDVFFTKNGRGLTSPWVLMRLRDVVDLYLTSRSLGENYYRLKGT
ncbi:MAG: hypothetical protein ISR64_01105 [Deltaproteobacteria bacterium]|nr:hypothetical protein [Deltaproteobacteria bacterium]